MSTPTATRQLRKKILQRFSSQNLSPRITTTRESIPNLNRSYTTQQQRPCLACRYGQQHDTYKIAQAHRPSLQSQQQRQQRQQPRYLSQSIRRASPQPNSADNDNPASAPASTPDITNYYTIFPTTIPSGPPPASPFDVPVALLRREFLKLQAIAHPDKFPAGPAKARAESLSSRINEAYRTLVDPLSRAQYLLREWHGIDVTAEDGEAAGIQLDPETLMAVMDVQETIEEVSQRENAQAEIERLKEENVERIRDTVEKLGRAFDEGDVEAAKLECVRLRFWYSVGEGLREWEPGRSEIRLIH
jgi:molecular chaperone HscB